MHDLGPVLAHDGLNFTGRCSRPDRLGREVERRGVRPDGRLPGEHVVAGLAQDLQLVVHDAVLAGERAREVPRVQHQDPHRPIATFDVSEPRGDAVGVGVKGMATSVC